MRTTSKPGVLGALAAALALSACSSGHLVQVAPRVDLASLGTIGMVEFRSTQGSDELSRQTNRRFLQEIQGAQPGLPVLELAADAAGLGGPASRTLDPATVRALGEQHRVDALLVGVLDAKEVRPKVSIDSGLASLNAKAEVEGTLTAKLYDTRTGATLWTCAVADSRTIAALSVSGGGLSGGGTADADGTRSELFEALAIRATADFRPTWVRVRE